MKALVLTFGILISVITVKAQQNTQFSLNKTKRDTSYRGFYKGDFGWPDLNNNAPVSSSRRRVIEMSIISSMPIAKLSNTDLRMPIVKTDRTAYTTPISGMNLPRIYNMKKVEFVEVFRTK